MSKDQITRPTDPKNIEDSELEQSRRLAAGIYGILGRCFPSSSIDAETSERYLREIASALPMIRELMGHSRWDFASVDGGESQPFLILRRRIDYELMRTHTYGQGTTAHAYGEFAELWILDAEGKCREAVEQSKHHEFAKGHGTHSKISPRRENRHSPRPELLAELLRELLKIIKSENGLIPVEQRSVTGVTKTLRPEIASALRFPTS